MTPDQQKIVTVISTDIRNFTYHSRPFELQNESDEDFHRRFSELCDIVRDFYNPTLDTIARHDTERQAIVLPSGDGLIIAFQDAAHAVTAFRSALNLRDSYNKFFKGLNDRMNERRRSVKLSYGMGMHTGFSVIRHYQSYENPGNDEELILGDALNIATRCEQLTKEHPGCGIMLSEHSLRALREQLCDEELDVEFLDYQVHSIRGYKPLRLYGIAMKGKDD
jgi:class 3 adenylate cyclase